MKSEVSQLSNNKRIAKNTLMLYFRMLLTMVVSLFTVRVILNTLGVEDYGIYNLVGGIVTSFAFLSSTISSATQRFFAFELGTKNYSRLKKIFGLTISIYIGIAIVIVILAEFIGLWFLNYKLNIPSDRMDAAHWVFQFSILSFIAVVLSTPFEAIIMAREKMSFYAYISIIEVVFRLIIVYLLVLFEFDKLKLYAVLTFIVTFLLKAVYFVYCRNKFEETRFYFLWDKKLFIELSSYAGWNLFGALTAVSFNQGVSFLLNIFFGPAVNASRGVAMQVNNAVSSFSSNFYSAVRPQIIKNYATHEKERMLNLVFKSTKYSFFLLMVLSIPILLNTNYILSTWLKIVPEHSERFVQLTMWFNLINLLQIPITTAVQATGKIKHYQIVIGLIMLLCLPFSYVGLKFGYPAEIVFYVMILVSLVALVFRLFILKKLINYRYLDYFNKVLLRIIIVLCLSHATSQIVVHVLFEYVYLTDFWRFLFFSVASIILSSFYIFYTGLDKYERQFLVFHKNEFLRKYIFKGN